MDKAYINGKVFTGDRFETGKAILVREGVISGLLPEEQLPAQLERVDLGGNFIAPSFIDLQIYGGNGHMFSQELSLESLEAVYAYCLSGGCTHFMITLATNTLDRFFQAMEVVKAYWAGGGKGLLGMHMEGPYLNPVKKGAHPAELIRVPDVQEIRQVLQKGSSVLRMMTIAPECQSEEVLTLLKESGLLLSAGHSNASYAEAMKALDDGIPTATHLFNAMSAFQHRAPGLPGALFNHRTAMSSIVCDGIHVDYAAVRVAARLMQGRLFYITDAVSETKEGIYKHVFQGDRYSLPDGTLSGSALTMMQAVRNGIQQAGISLEESLRMASQYPASLLGNAVRLGRIREGYEACFVVFDEDLQLKETIAH